MIGFLRVIAAAALVFVLWAMLTGTRIIPSTSSESPPKPSAPVPAVATMAPKVPAAVPAPATMAPKAPAAVPASATTASTAPATVPAPETRGSTALATAEDFAKLNDAIAELTAAVHRLNKQLAEQQSSRQNGRFVTPKR